MIDSLFEKRPRRHIRDLNIVPILDMLTTVIFFLLMSTTFFEYTKITVPPSTTSVSTSDASDPPLSPKLLLNPTSKGLQLLLTWAGKQPGEKQELVSEADPDKLRQALAEKSAKLASEFAKDHAGEKTIQIGLGPALPYQNLVSMMDGVRDSLPDVVLISSAEAEARKREP